jgi:glycosyltransferase involved in cell wall biosynthesis
LIVNDDSVDQTLSIATKWKKLDSRIKIFSNKKTKGPSYSRNFAVKKSTGKWISILDSDDYYEPEKLQHQINYLHKKKNIVIIGSDHNIINKKGKKLSSYFYQDSNNKLKNNLINHRAFPIHSSLLINAKYFKMINGYNNYFPPAEDYDLCLRLIDKGVFANIKKILVNYRVHKHNISHNNKKITPLDYAIISKICYLYRKNKMKDPSILPQEEWNIFFNKACCNLTVLNTKGYYLWRKKIKNYLERKNFFCKFKLGFQNFLKNYKYFFLFFVLKYYKNSYAEICFKKLNTKY